MEGGVLLPHEEQFWVHRVGLNSLPDLALLPSRDQEKASAGMPTRDQGRGRVGGS